MKLLFSLFLASIDSTTSAENLRGGGEADEEGNRRLTPVDYDVIIVGAGWAGLAAARELIDENDNNYMIYEARDYIGGRCQTIEMGPAGSKFKIEKGAQWIHGHNSVDDGNYPGTDDEVYNVAREAETANLVTLIDVDYEDDLTWYSKEYNSGAPHKLTSTERTAVEAEYTAWENEYYPANGSHNTVQDQVNAYKMSENLSADKTLALDFTLDSGIVQEYAGALNELDYSKFDYDEWMGTAYSDTVMEEGYGAVVDYFVDTYLNSGDKITLNSKVKKIDLTDSDYIDVTYCTLDTNGACTGTDIVKSAKVVIVTVPLGVMKAGDIEFIPASTISSAKQTAINTLEMGVLDKVIMRWDSTTTLPWHADNTEWMEFITSTQGKWTTFTNQKKLTGDNVLIAFEAGTEAERVDDLTEADVKAEVLASLRAIFDGIDEVPDPVEWEISQWAKDPFAYGSYSINSLGVSAPSTRNDLCDSVGAHANSQRLFFAGEACSNEYFGTTAGAYITGKEQGWQASRKV